MLVVLAHYPGDEEQALRLATWIKDLGPYPGHELLLIADVRSTRSLAIRAEFDGAGFDKIEELVNPSIIDGWPHAANFVFSMAARHIAATSSRPFLWLEPDVVPMRGGWLDTLQTAYKLAKQPFFGDYVNVDNVPPHCSGIAIYPGDLIEAGAGNALIAGDIAWDCAAANQILPKLHKTKLVGHAWRHPPFANQGEVDNLRGQHPEMLLFHADKSGSLIDLLRIERNKGGDRNADSTTDTKASGETATTAAAVTSRGGEELQHTPRPSKDMTGKSLDDIFGPRITCDIFIKTYPPDYPWLAYCLRSINTFAHGFRKLIAVSPEAPSDKLRGFHPGLDMEWRTVGEQPDGYLWQMVIKLDADRYTDASHILYIDSDTIFIRPVSPDIYMQGAKVVWMLTPYEKVTTPWQQVIEKFLKKPVAFEFMRRQPFLVPRWLLAELRAFCEREHGVTLDAYVLSQPHRAFSEFNALGAFAYEYFRDEFVWVNTEETPPDQWPVLTVLQSWSRGGLTDEIKKRYEEILDGETSVIPRIGDNGGEEVQGNGIEDAPEPEETSLPTLAPQRKVKTWSKVPVAARWDRVEELVLELKGFCDSPVATARVRKALEGGKILPAGTITKIQRRKWRKKYRAKRKANQVS